jgi:hypothetical protein
MMGKNKGMLYPHGLSVLLFTKPSGKSKRIRKRWN